MDQSAVKNAKILVVDDEPSNVLLLEGILEKWGCEQVRVCLNGRSAVEIFVEFQPDLVLLDLMMPGMDGFQVMEALKAQTAPGDYRPVLMVTADTSTPSRHKALDLGAKDFLTKPFNMVELTLRVNNLLETRFLHVELQNRNRILDDEVALRTEELAQSEMETVECLASAGEFRDDDTGQHTNRVGETSGRLAAALGLDSKRVELIQRASPLHDVGKIGIADGILLKPGKLTDEEFATMKEHAAIGARILARHHTPLLQLASIIALTHHERWAGNGYPNKVEGENIPIEGRIVAVADVFDALTHERPYKKAWPVEEAVTEITSQAGRQFDPAVVEAFGKLKHEELL